MNLEKIIEDHYGKPIPDEWDKEYHPLYNVTISEIETLMREAVRQALERAADKGALHANNLFAELASDNGRLIHPSLVCNEMKEVIKSVEEDIE